MMEKTAFDDAPLGPPEKFTIERKPVRELSDKELKMHSEILHKTIEDSKKQLAQLIVDLDVYNRMHGVVLYEIDRRSRNLAIVRKLS